MPRFFFHVFDDREYIQDRNGVELIDVLEAKRELLRLVRLLPERLLRPGARVALHDEAGNMLDERWVKAEQRLLTRKMAKASLLVFFQPPPRKGAPALLPSVRRSCEEQTDYESG